MSDQLMSPDEKLHLRLQWAAENYREETGREPQVEPTVKALIDALEAISMNIKAEKKLSTKAQEILAETDAIVAGPYGSEQARAEWAKYRPALVGLMQMFEKKGMEKPVQ